MTTTTPTTQQSRGPAAGYAFYRQPVKVMEGGKAYWKYRRGGYNPEDGTYGRCGTRADAWRIIRRHFEITETFVRMFQPRFASQVEAGTKLQTVRPMPSRMPMEGDRISLRAWTGKPYRSKQRVLCLATIAEVADCVITETSISVDSLAVPEEAFAKADGFKDEIEMRAWFRSTHGLPFEGILIRWHNNQAERP